MLQIGTNWRKPFEAKAIMQPLDQNPSSDLLQLTCGRLQASIAPHIGGCLASFDADGQAMMRRANDQANDPLEMACYPLLPFIGRIAFGHFHFDGRDITLRAHPLATPHALHGEGWQRPWRVIEHTETLARIGFTHHENTGNGWPWNFEASETFSLDETSLTIALEIENTSRSPMPAGLGLHPFFEARLDARLTGDLPHIWETAPDTLPTNRTEVTAVRSLKRGRRIAPLTLDHCFSGGTGPFDIEWETRALSLRIHRGDAPHTVIYTPQEYDFFCVEPVTHIPNAVNRQEPSEITGLRILAPGERMQLSSRFEVRGPN